MGLNLTRFSPIPMVGNTVPQTPVSSGTTTPVPTSTPRPSGRSHLNNHDPIPNKQYMHVPNLYNSFLDLQRQFKSQNLTGPESGPESLGTDDSTPTFNITKFYPDEIPFRNQGISPAPPQPVELVGTQTTPVNLPTGTSGTQTSPPRIPNTQNGTENNPHNQILAREVRERLHKIVRPDHNCNQAPAAVAPTQPQHFNPGT